VVRLSDARDVTLRDATAEDLPRIARLYSELTPESFRSRFYSGHPKPALIERLARIDIVPGTVSVVAVTAAEPDRLVAEARYLPDAGGAAEIGLTVEDEFQGLGLGHHLLAALVEHAAAVGIERLSALVSLRNSPMLHLLVQRGVALTEPADESWVVSLEFSTVGGMPGWPDSSSGNRVLVERRGWFNQDFAVLTAGGYDVRQCFGPDLRSGRACPLIESGRCRLAEQADCILTLLPGDDPDCRALTAAHRRLWPDKIVLEATAPS
jgi:GNAT superfamily N-acetyltransferase